MIAEKFITFLYTLDYSDSTPYEIWDVNPPFLSPPDSALQASSPGAKSPVLSVVAEPPEPDSDSDGPDDLEAETDEAEAEITEAKESASSDGYDKFAPLVLNARVYTIAERYNLWALKHLGQKKFEARVEDDGWNDEGFSHAIREVFEYTTDQDKGMHQILVWVAAEYIKTLRDRGEFNDGLSEVPDFTRGLLEEVLDTAKEPQRYCAQCRRGGYPKSFQYNACSRCGVKVTSKLGYWR